MLWHKANLVVCCLQGQFAGVRGYKVNWFGLLWEGGIEICGKKGNTVSFSCVED